MGLLQIKSEIEDKTRSFIEDYLASVDCYFIRHPEFVNLNHLYFGWDRVVIEYYENSILQGVLVGNAVNNKFISIPHFSYAGLYFPNEALKQTMLNKLIGSRFFSHYQIRDEQRYEKFIDVSDKVSGYLTLPATYEELLVGFKSKLRSQIKRSNQFNLCYEVSSDYKMLPKFYEPYSRHMHALGSFPIPLGYLKTLFLLDSSIKTEVHLVRLNEVVVAGGITVGHNNVTEITWAFSLHAFNKYQTNMFLYSKIMEHAVSQFCTAFSFGRTSAGSNGLRFKKQWGTTMYDLPWNTWSEGEKNLSSQKSDGRVIKQISNYIPFHIRNMITEYVHRIKY